MDSENDDEIIGTAHNLSELGEAQSFLLIRQSWCDWMMVMMMMRGAVSCNGGGGFIGQNHL